MTVFAGVESHMFEWLKSYPIVCLEYLCFALRSKSQEKQRDMPYFIVRCSVKGFFIAVLYDSG